MTVIDEAAARPTTWRAPAQPAARQDARRRAAVAAVDAVAALGTAAVLAPWLHVLPWETALLVPASWTICAWGVGAYRHRRLKGGLVDLPSLVRTGALLCALAGVLGALTPLAGVRALVLVAVPATTLAALAGRLALLPLTRRALAPAPIAVVGPAALVWEFLASTHWPGAAPCTVAAVCLTDEPTSADSALTAELAANGLERAFTLGDLPGLVRSTGADTVVVVGGMERTGLRELAWRLERLAVGVAVTPLWPVTRQRIAIRMLGGTTAIEVSPPQYDGGRLAVREVIDRALAAAALVALAPVLLAIAVTIKVTSPGPVLFSHQRTGYAGQRFRLLKFRTMVPNAEALKATLTNEYSEGTLFKNRRDPRITRVGAWLRKFSLDELPQLINVLRGDMLLVGPRPTSTPFEAMPIDYSRRTLVKPGLTGLWQVSGRSDLPWEDAVRLDLHYVENRSLELDLDILLRRTLPAVLGRRGAY